MTFAFNFLLGGLITAKFEWIECHFAFTVWVEVLKQVLRFRPDLIRLDIPLNE